MLYQENKIKFNLRWKVMGTIAVYKGTEQKNILFPRHFLGNANKTPKRSMKYLLMNTQHTPELHRAMTVIKHALTMKRDVEV